MSAGASFSIARHAAVNVTGICHGQYDVPTSLTARKAADALLLALDTSRSAIARVWASPWERSRAVAEHIALDLGVELHVDRRISELSFGEWEGRAWADIESTDSARFSAWMRDWKTAAPPGGERVADLVARVDAWRRERVAETPSFVVSHAGVVRALRSLARGVDYDVVMREPVLHLTIEQIGPGHRDLRE